MHLVSTIAIALLATVGLSEIASAAEHAPTAPHSSAATQELATTREALRDLWLGHIFSVREVVRAVADKDAALAKVAEGRAVENARSIAAAIEPFYGKPASQQLFDLLAGHYTAIKDHAGATTAGNTAEAKKAFERLVANANEIAGFLSAANPHLPKNTLSSMLLAHGGHHVKQNQQIAKADWQGEARTWDEIKTHIYAISDALAGALAKQFPEQF